MEEMIKAKEAARLAEKYHYEKEHAKQVMDMAINLFDGLHILHGLGPEERELLASAAILHDIGFSAGGGNKHHKESRDIIISSDIVLGTDEDKKVVAMVARYHKGALPKDRHKYYKDLDEITKAKVSKLAAILRVADGLDRSHRNAVTAIKVFLGDPVVIRIRSEVDPSQEIEGVREKSDLFEKVFKRKVHVEKAA